MKNFKLNSKFYLFIVFFAVVGVVAVHMGFTMLFDGETGDGVVLPAVFALAGATYFIVAITMILQLVFYKGIGLKMNNEGINRFVQIFIPLFTAWEISSENIKKTINIVRYIYPKIYLIFLFILKNPPN